LAETVVATAATELADEAIATGAEEAVCALLLSRQGGTSGNQHSNGFDYSDDLTAARPAEQEVVFTGSHSLESLSEELRQWLSATKSSLP
jgi:hypothetical protein